MAKQLDSLSKGLQRVTRTNDSLNKELYYYRAKDDFYVMAVDRQGSHFEWLVGIALGFTGLVTYGFFWSKINAVEKSFRQAINKFERESAKTTFKLHKQAYDTLGIAAALFRGFSGLSLDDDEGNEPIIPLISTQLSMLDEIIHAYILIQNEEDQHDIDDTAKTATSLMQDLHREVSLAFEGDRLKIDKDEGLKVFDHDGVKQLNSLHKMVAEIKDTAVRIALMNAILQLEQFKALVLN
ncbi:hypothetical protein GCM10027577_29870 [Spirosoma fluminis]